MRLLDNTTKILEMLFVIRTSHRALGSVRMTSWLGVERVEGSREGTNGRRKVPGVLASRVSIEAASTVARGNSPNRISFS